MKLSRVKIALVFTLYAVLHVAEACIDCECGEVPPYFDYSALKANVTSPLAQPDTLKIVIIPDGLSFLACNSRKSPGLIPSAYGCSCNEPGDAGPKYPVAGISITADQAFNDTLPAGVSLNDLFRISDTYSLRLRYQLDKVPQLNHWDYGFFPGYGGALLTCTEAPATTGVPFQFVVTFTKSNGEAISVATPEITW